MLTGDVVSGAAVFGSLLGYLPPMVALAALVWYLVQIWESDTAQGLIHGPVKVARRKRAKYRARSVLHFERNQAMVRAAEARAIGKAIDPVEADERKEAAQIVAAIIERDTK